MSNTKDQSKPLEVNCPSCQKKVPWVEVSTFRPFCSERCKQVDLGAWATESYAIPAEPIGEWSEEANSTNGTSGSYTLQ